MVESAATGLPVVGTGYMDLMGHLAALERASSLPLACQIELNGQKGLNSM